MADLNTGGGKTIQENTRRNLENSLKKLRTDFLDLYLIHNINSDVWDGIRKYRIIEEYEKFRAEGLIRAIGFSFHGNFSCFKEVLEFYDWDMCQMQQSLIDVDKETTEEGMRLAGKKGCALVIMEPLRGGCLATPPMRVQALYNDFPVKRSAVEWAFRHLLDYPEVSTVLSGMTTLAQLKENIEIFSGADALPGCVSEKERELLTRARLAYESVQTIPCTGCEYCLPCPRGVDIPGVFTRYNDGNMFESFDQPKRSYMFLERQKKDATLCESCGACEKKCPQRIKITEQLNVAHEALKGWIE